jgi:hypothetical protein
VIAALYVLPGGPYSGLADVELWDRARDARTYAGPWPVVAHPPCERWGRYWSGGPRPGARRRELGDDDGCFEAALAAVRRWGGVLEHPAHSQAWAAHGLLPPDDMAGWTVADWDGGWTCCVEQGHYGHRARKPTWLYAHSVELPSLTWGPSRLTSAVERRPGRRQDGILQRLSARQRAVTPELFRDVLLSIAATARRTS